MMNTGGDSIQFEPYSESNSAFVFDCLAELRGDVEVSLESFRDYMDRLGVEGGGARILVALDSARRVGLLTVNRYAIPRYVGFGVELEEVVIHPEFQGEGLGSRMVEAFLDSVAHDPSLRRVTVRTDSDGAARSVYLRFFGETKSVGYSRAVSYLGSVND
jgi:GNAT superfamily N-acetyltransferase